MKKEWSKEKTSRVKSAHIFTLYLLIVGLSITLVSNYIHGTDAVDLSFQETLEICLTGSFTVLALYAMAFPFIYGVHYLADRILKKKEETK